MGNFNLVSLDPSVNPYAKDAVGVEDAPDGLPASDGTHEPAASKGILDSAIEGTENAIAGVYNAGKHVVSDVVEGAENVVQKTVNIGTGAITGVTTNLVLILGVIVVGLVLIAKSGAVKISR